MKVGLNKGLQAVLDGEYALPEGFDPGEHPVILDIGGNVGAFTLWAKHQWPKSTVHVYEPNPKTFKDLEVNLEGMAVHLNKVGVRDFEGKARLYAPRPGGTPGECSFKDTGEVDLTKGGIAKVIDAATLPLADILKLDTEGCELEILAHYPHLNKAKAVVLEWHSHADRAAIRNLMLASGFQLVQDTEWHWAGRGIQKFVKGPAIKLFVGILAGGGKSWDEFNSSVDGLKELLPRNGVSVAIAREAGTGVDRARNRLVASALADPDVTHFLFLDNDIVFDPTWVLNMIRSNLDVVGAAYPRKQIDWELVEKAVKDGVSAKDLPSYATSHIYNTVVDNSGGVNARSLEGIGDFVQVEEVGTGFLLFKRTVLDKMLAAYGSEMAYVTDYPPRGEVHHMMFACQRDPACELEKAKRALLEAVDRYWGDALKGKPSRGSLGDFNFAGKHYAEAVAKGKAALGRYTTEDYSWCRLWRMLGGQIYVYIDASVAHMGVMKYEGAVKRYLQKQTQPNKEEKEEKPKTNDG